MGQTHTVHSGGCLPWRVTCEAFASNAVFPDFLLHLPLNHPVDVVRYRHVDAPPALKNGACDTPGVVKLLHIDLRDGSQARCGDLTPDGTLIAAGSRRGLHLFGVHLKEVRGRGQQA